MLFIYFLVDQRIRAMNHLNGEPHFEVRSPRQKANEDQSSLYQIDSKRVMRQP